MHECSQEAVRAAFFEEHADRVEILRAEVSLEFTCKRVRAYAPVQEHAFPCAYVCENKIHTKCIQQRKQGCDWELAAFFEEYSSKRSCRYPAGFAYLCAVHSFQELYTVCSVGSFSSKTSTGQTTCTKCPDGYTSNPGASSALDCYITGFGRRSKGDRKRDRDSA